MNKLFLRLAIGAFGIAALAACSNGASHVAASPPPAKVGGSFTDSAFVLLMEGHEQQAAVILHKGLRRDPQNASAHLLLDSVERDPKELLGPRNYPYTVRQGDTVLGLAQRFLGNQLLAYRFLRYNGLKAPATLAVGQELLIPGEPPAPPPPPVRTESPAHPDDRLAHPKPRVAKLKAAAPVAVACNLRASQQARAAGLSALNQGNVARAVSVLTNAAALYPCNPQIARDLARAQRIAATVKARK